MYTQCLICNNDVPRYEMGIAHGNKIVNCRVCGEYIPSEFVAIQIHDRTLENSYLYSAAMRENYEKALEPIKINSLSDLIDSVNIPKNPLESIDHILLFIMRKEKTADEGFSFTETDYSVGYARDFNEFRRFLSMATQLNYLDHISNATYQINHKGWERLIYLTQNSINSSRAFVAMSFDINLKEIWEIGLKPALIQTGYSPTRMDIVEHNGKIDDQIVTEIRKSGLVVADFTGGRAGVYFEAGLAMGIGIPVIWSCKESDIGNLHFDTRQYNYIAWNNVTELKEKLIYRIEATLPNRGKRVMKI